METILITGGAGFVGSCLAIGIRRAMPDVRVVALDNLKRRGSELNLPRLRDAGITFVHGDIRNPEDIDAAGAMDLILECSAEPSVLAGYQDSPQYVVNTNLVGTLNCLEAARRHGAGILFLSTSRVYPCAAVNALAYREEATRFALEPDQAVPGASERGIAEEFPLEGARSLYGATKLCSELVLHEYLDMYGLRGIVNRCGVLTGPWQMGKVDQGVIVLWVARHVFGQPLRYIGFGGQGKQVRDLLHVDDLLRLVLYQIERLDTLSGQTFNVGGGAGVSVSLCELTELCREVTGNRIEITADPTDRPADLRLYISDNTRVTKVTGWRPEKDVRTIVADIHAWILEHREALRAVLT
ncbi:MAG TPA: NAD-dependent epimerase/dehydratase family protein [Candidatus Hydrogenedentes bacterium]|nr:NAD-dependent epimerase/dehydratase family protein [Candidatus Hydrogenedentota bacterium]